MEFQCSAYTYFGILVYYHTILRRHQTHLRCDMIMLEDTISALISSVRWNILSRMETRLSWGKEDEQRTVNNNRVLLCVCFFCPLNRALR